MLGLGVVNNIYTAEDNGGLFINDVFLTRNPNLLKRFNAIIYNKFSLSQELFVATSEEIQYVNPFYYVYTSTITRMDVDININTSYPIIFDGLVIWAMIKPTPKMMPTNKAMMALISAPFV